MKIVKIIALFLLLGFANHSYGQKIIRLQIDSADSLKGSSISQKLWGHVKFTHENTIIFCDTAYSYEADNTMEAIGHVKILQGDSITITSKKLFYNGNTKMAKLREDVVYRDDSMTMYTDHLDYDMAAKEAFYFEGGKIVDSKNVLVSEKGYYDTKVKFASFKDDAVLTTPEAIIKGDTLQYDLNTDIAYFKGPTDIEKSDGSTLNATKGRYITRIEKSIIEQGTIVSGDQVLKGDAHDFDDLNKYYTSTGHVKMTSIKDEVIITGEFGKYWASDSLIKVYGNAVMKKAFNGDTLYMSADTLVSIDSPDPSKKRLLAYNNVKLYNKDMQGKADSLAYHLSDSIIYFYNDPVIWNNSNQIEADSINMVMKNDNIDHMNMTDNSFVISNNELLFQYDQVKGKEMIAYFTDNEINKVDVFGNAESLYFVAENDSILFGMNKIVCTDMRILFNDGDVDKINTYVKPDATLTPPHEIKEENTRLENYQWRESEKPTKEEVLSGKSNVPPEKEEKPVEKPPIIEAKE